MPYIIVTALLIAGLFCLLGIPFAVIRRPWDKLTQPGRLRRERIRRITGKPARQAQTNGAGRWTHAQKRRHG